jgi:hypothetical protein
VNHLVELNQSRGIAKSWLPVNNQAFLLSSLPSRESGRAERGTSRSDWT